MLFERHDYILLNVDDKTKLAQVINRGDGKKRKNEAILEDGIETDDPVKVQFAPGDIVANLGKEPKRGQKVYGVDIQLFEDFIELKGFPFEVLSYREMSDKDCETFIACMHKAKKILKPLNATDWMGAVDRMVIKPKKGKMAGYYKFKNLKGGVPQDELGLTPESFDVKQELLYIILHEMSHGIWFRQVPKDIQARWAKLFAKRAVLQRSQQDALLNLFGLVKAMQKEGMDFRAIKKHLRAEYEEEFRIFDDVLKHIKKVWHVEVEEAESLLKNDEKKFFSLWPAVTDLTDWTYDVSEYATTSVKEFFAESMAFHLCGMDLPADVTKYCKNTLSRLTRTYE